MGRAGRAETCVLNWNGICRSTWCPATSWKLETLPINQQTGKLERKALPALRERRPAVKQRTPLSKHATAGRASQGLAGAMERSPWMSTLNHWKMIGTSLISAATP